MSKSTANANNYVIMGPRLRRGNGVLEAIYSLYYLPLRYTLVLPVMPQEDADFYDEVVETVHTNALENRVRFIKTQQGSPEAFASAVLSANR